MYINVRVVLLMMMASFVRLFTSKLLDGDLVSLVERWVTHFLFHYLLLLWSSNTVGTFFNPYTGHGHATPLCFMLLLLQEFLWVLIGFVFLMQQIHCGCIVSFHTFVLLDAGGIECLSCARKSFILVRVIYPPLYLVDVMLVLF